MSAATLDTAATFRVASNVPVVAPLSRDAAGLPTRAPQRRTRVAAPRTLAAGARSCAVERPEGGLGDRALLAIMVVIAAVFLVGLAVMVHGFWVISQTPIA